MEDQGKRLLLAVAIAFALLWGWSILFPPEAPEKPAETDQTQEVAEPTDRGVSDVTSDPEPCLLYTSPSPRDLSTSRMPSSA